MGDDTASRVGWGVVLGGHAFDLAYWKEALKRPFDPWIMETEGRLVLRSTVLDPAATSSEAYELAKGLMERVNGALAISHHNAEVVRVEAVAEIMSDGASRRHVVQAAGTAKARSKAGAVGVAIGPDGKPVPPPPPERSNAQRWLLIAAEDDLLADALTYVARGDDWFDIYKALGCLELKFGGKRKGQVERFRRLGWADPDKIELLRWTANSGRHARLKFDPPPNPMERTEARDLLAKLIARAFDEAGYPASRRHHGLARSAAG
jgi:hypothetical protein